MAETNSPQPPWAPPPTVTATDNIGNRKTAQEPAGELAYAANGLQPVHRHWRKRGSAFCADVRRLGQPDPHQDVNGHLDGGVQRGQPRDEFHQPRRRDSRGMRLRLPGTKVHEEGDGNGTVASHERYLYTAICW